MTQIPSFSSVSLSSAKSDDSDQLQQTDGFDEMPSSPRTDTESTLLSRSSSVSNLTGITLADIAPEAPEVRLNRQKVQEDLNKLALWAVHHGNTSLLTVLLGSALECETDKLLDEVHATQIKLRAKEGLRDWLKACATVLEQHQTQPGVNLNELIKPLATPIQSEVEEKSVEWAKRQPGFFFKGRFIETHDRNQETAESFGPTLDHNIAIYTAICLKAFHNELKTARLKLQTHLDKRDYMKLGRILEQMERSTNRKAETLQERVNDLGVRIATNAGIYENQQAWRYQQLTIQQNVLPLEQRRILYTYGEEILRYYVPVDLQASDTGNSLLHEAVLKYHLEAVEFLLSQNANLLLKNKEGQSPMALSLRHQDQAKCFDLFLNAFQCYVDKLKKEAISKEFKLAFDGLSQVEEHLIKYGKTLSSRSKYSERWQRFWGYKTYLAERGEQYSTYCASYGTAMQNNNPSLVVHTVYQIAQSAKTRFFNKGKSELNDKLSKLVEQYEKRHAGTLTAVAPARDEQRISAIKRENEVLQQKLKKEQQLSKLKDEVLDSRDKKIEALEAKLTELGIKPPVTDVSIQQVITESGLAGMGFHFTSIPGDGHCLYNAVSLYLGSDVSSLRQIVADYLAQNAQELAPFITLVHGQTLEDYLDAVRNGREWASHTEIEILMRVLDRPIVVVTAGNRMANPDASTRFLGAPIFVHYNGINHYDGLTLRQGMDARVALNRLLEQTTAATSQLVTQPHEQTLTEQSVVQLPRPGF